MEKQEYTKILIINSNPKTYESIPAKFSHKINTSIEDLIGREFEIADYGDEWEDGLYVKYGITGLYFIFTDEFKFIE